MSKLKNMRTSTKKKLREIAEAVGVTPQTVQQMEITGIRKPVTAKQYLKAFPGLKMEDLLEGSN